MSLTDDPEPIDVTRTRNKWRAAVRERIDHRFSGKPNRLLARALDANERYWANEMDRVSRQSRET